MTEQNEAPGRADSAPVGLSGTAPRRPRGAGGGRRTSTGVPLLAVTDSGPAALAAGEPEPAVGERALAGLLAAAEAANTTRAYGSAWRRFAGWCAEHEHPALPAAPRTVALYLAAAATDRTPDGEYSYTASTFGVWLAAIGHQHQAAGYTDPAAAPLVRRALRGARRDRAKAGQVPAKATALGTTALTRILDTIAADATGWKAQVAARRDTALLVVGYAAALRRSELAGLQVRDLTVYDPDDPERARIEVALRGSKTDQDRITHVYLRRGTGPARTCPWCTLMSWFVLLTAADTAALAAERDGTDPREAVTVAVIRALRRDQPDPGTHRCGGAWPVPPRRTAPIFRPLDRGGVPHARTALSGRSAATIVKNRAAQAGCTPEETATLSGHSLRAGFVTEALDRGATVEQVMRQTRHRRPETVLGYDRNPRWRDNATDHLGL